MNRVLTALSMLVLSACGATSSAGEPAPAAASTAAECVPRICGRLLCGHGDDGCGDELNCGGCPALRPRIAGHEFRMLAGTGVPLWLEARGGSYQQVRCSESAAPQYSATLVITGPGETRIERPFSLSGSLDPRAGRGSADHCILNQPSGVSVAIPPLTIPGYYRVEVLSPDLPLSAPVRSIVVVEELIPRSEPSTLQ